MKKLRAFWKDRTPQLGICEVKLIDFENNTASISNGAVRVFPKLDEINIIRPTEITDSNGDEIYEGDYVKDKETIYVVRWNRNNTSFWLSPVKSLKIEDLILLVLNSHTLGNGYFSRKDLTIIGNEYTSDIHTLS